MSNFYCELAQDDSDTDFEIVNFPPESPPLRTVDGLVTVDLLTYDPPSIFPWIKYIKNVQVLKVHTNNLGDIPQNISRLGNLQHLVLRRHNSKKGKGVSSLPDSLEDLTNLNTLDIKLNPLYNVPRVVFKLSGLVNLDVSYCQLRCLPVEIQNLTHLSKLRLTGNTNIQIQAGVYKLTGLTHLYADNCGLKSISSEVKNLTKLEVLILSNNFIKELPVGFYYLKSLSRCYVDHNNLTSISSKIEELTALMMLVLDTNSISHLPDEIFRLSSLKCLSVKSNKLSAIPSIITKMPHLEQIFVDKNPLLRPPVCICNQGLSAVRHFFEKAEKVSLVPHNRRVQLVILGESEAGKTSLAKALVFGMPCTQDAQHLSTVGLEFYLWKPDPNNDDLEVRLVDCAGQKRYQLTHYFFIREGSLFMIVVNLERYCQHDDNFQELIGDWLDLVIALVPSATIIIVPTHTDKCSKPQVDSKCQDILIKLSRWEKDRKKTIQSNIEREEDTTLFVTETEHERVLDHLGDLARNRPVISSVYQEDEPMKEAVRMVPVSNDVGLSGMKELTKEVARVANNTTLCECVGINLPESWVKMEELFHLKRDDRKPTMAFIEFEQMAKTVGLTDCDLAMAIDYWNSIGELLYFGDIQELHNVVFLNPKWLANLMKLLFRHEHRTSLVYNHDKFYRICDEHQFDYYREELCKQAILSTDLLRCIWHDVFTDNDMLNNLIALLKHFGLACDVNHDEQPCPSPLPSYSPSKRYLVPWFLSSDMSESINARWKQAFSNFEICTKFVINNGCPTGLLERLMVHCHSHADFLEPWLTGAYLVCDDVHILLKLSKGAHHCTLEIVARYSGQNCNYMCTWKALIPILQHAERLLSSQEGVCFRRYSLCSSCIATRKGQPCHHPCDWLRPGKAVFKNSIVCVKCQEKVDIHQLIPPQQVLSEVFLTSSPVSEGLNVRLFDMLANKLGNDWRSLGRQLGLEQGEIDNIISDNTNHQKEQIVAMLTKWRNKIGKSATRSRLVACLQQVGRLDLCPDVFNF